MTVRGSFIRKLSIALAAPLLLTTRRTALAVPASAAVTRWTPKPGIQWQWQLSSSPTAAELRTAYAAGARAFDIDGDGSTAASVNAIHALGPGVGAVCYIDVGGWEDSPLGRCARSARFGQGQNHGR